MHTSARSKLLGDLVSTAIANIYHRHSITYQKHHEDVGPAALQKYAAKGAACLALLLRNHSRPSPEYNFNTTPDITTCSQNLLDAYALTQAASATGDHQPDDHDSGDESDRHEETDTQPPNTSGSKKTKYSPIVQPALRGLLAAIFTQLPGPHASGRFYSTIMRYLVLAALKSNGKGEWRPSGDISQDVAAMLFIGRLTIFSIMDQGLEANNEYNYHK